MPRLLHLFDYDYEHEALRTTRTSHGSGAARYPALAHIDAIFHAPFSSNKVAVIA
jgi:hypothetical protein